MQYALIRLQVLLSSREYRDFVHSLRTLISDAMKLRPEIVERSSQWVSGGLRSDLGSRECHSKKRWSPTRTRPILRSSDDMQGIRIEVLVRGFWGDDSALLGVLDALVFGFSLFCHMKMCLSESRAVISAIRVSMGK